MGKNDKNRDQGRDDRDRGNQRGRTIIGAKGPGASAIIGAIGDNARGDVRIVNNDNSRNDRDDTPDDQPGQGRHRKP